MASEDTPLFNVDMGTTRTRARVVQDKKIWASGSGDFGVRDVARGRSRDWLAVQLQNLLDAAFTDADRAGLKAYPSALIAAGMITSKEGLHEVPHLESPAGLKELAHQVYVDRFATSDFDDLPLLLVPGVRTGPITNTFDGTVQMDLMRGEETLCVGLLESGLLQPGSLLLNLGSHWKWIWIDEEKRIVRSRTTLTGEMIHAIQANTLIASALPQQSPKSLDAAWVQRGFTEAAGSGLGRALFCIRLFQQQKQGTDEQRLSFLYGAFLQNEFTHLKTNLGMRAGGLVIAGPSSLANMWKHYAEDEVATTVLKEADREKAYLRGLRSIYKLHA